MGNAVFVSTLQSGMIFDVSNPAAPVQVGSIREFESSVVVGNRMVLTGGESTGGPVDIFDVSEPLNPVQLGSYDPFYDLRGEIMGLDVAGKFMLVAVRINAQQGVTASFRMTDIVDISDPGSPVRVNTVMEGGQLAVFGDAVIIGGYAGFYSFDISDVSKPLVLRGPFTTSLTPSVWGDWWTHAMAAVGDRLYVADERLGLQVFEMKPKPVLQFDGGTLSIGGQVGQKYVLEFNADLSGTNWSGVQTITLTNSEAVIEGVSMNGARGFYRARVE